MKKLIIAIAATVILTGCGAAAKTDEPAVTESDTPKAEEVQEEAVPENAESTENTEAPEYEIPEVSKDVVTDEGFDQFAPPEKGETIAVMTTSMGVIKLKFFGDDAPKAVENFTTHAKNGYYDGLTFHRIISDFMIQGGDPEGSGIGGESIWGEPFEDEFTARLHNYRGALSMANSGPNTNGSQFFIVQAGPSAVEPNLDFIKAISDFEEAMYPDYRTGQIVSGAQRFTKKAVEIYETVGGTPWLDGGFPNDKNYVAGHTVFGQVFEGMDIVDAIASVATDASGMPAEPVVIEKIEITVN